MRLSHRYAVLPPQGYAHVLPPSHNRYAALSHIWLPHRYAVLPP